MKNIITGHPYDGCWSWLWSVILTMLQNMQQTGLTFMMPKISTIVLKTSYWYMVGFKCNDVSTCCEDVIFRISRIFYFIITVISYLFIAPSLFYLFSYFCINFCILYCSVISVISPLLLLIVYCTVCGVKKISGLWY